MIVVQCYLSMFTILYVSAKNRGYNYEPPEIIANDPLPPDQFGGYNYPVPPNPPFFDEPTTPNNLYGPPPNITLPPISNDIPDFPSYLPPTLEPPQFEPIPDEPPNQYLPPSTLYDTPKFRISNMSCLDSATSTYFRASMGLTRTIPSLPVIDDAPSDCISGSGDFFRLELEGERMRRCGVRFCSNGVNMCVTVRMPTVRGLKLPEDPVVMLRCRPQERVVAHTRQLRINTINSVQQARFAQPNTVISGGSQRGFDTQVALFRRGGGGGGPGDFSRLVTPGAAVQLGEELMLRAQVRDGDGWRSSRLSDVNIHHLSSGRVRQRAFTLLDSAGCRDARARSVVPQEVIQPNPLTSQLNFRAFMFQGMASGDEMVLSVRMLACLQAEDCQRVRTCDSRRTRRRRHINSTHATNAYNSILEFRVIAPDKNTPESYTLTNSTSNEVTERINNTKPIVLIMVTIGSIASMLAGFVILYLVKRK